MHRSVLIHSKNTPKNIQERFDTENVIEFDYTNSEYKSIDEYISTVVIEDLISKKINVIYIKDNLSNNYLELFGLRLAYHIRLTTQLKYVPIVILSDLDGCNLCKLEPMAKIIFTKNIFLEPNSLKSIEKYQDKVFSEFNNQNYKSHFLDLIQIDSPENSTNHSITNEWAIYKWAKELNVSNSDNIKNTISNISHQLYFKFLYQKNQIIENLLPPIQQQSNSQSVKTIKMVKKVEIVKKNILMIDDDSDKGWEDIFKEYFRKQKNYVFRTVKPVDIKNKCYEDIENAVVSEIESTSIPDLILLDMRIIELDNYEEDPKNISGIKLSEKIKSFNPGIQVIMLSATTRSDILEQASKDNKILGYIKKDHIDNNTISTKENIEKLSSLLKDGEKKFYLKDIWNIQQEILKLDMFSTDNYNEIKKEVEFIFELLDSSMEKRFIFAMLTIYKVLEIIKDLYIDDKSGKYLYYKVDDKVEIKAVVYENKIYKAVNKNILLSNPENYGFSDSEGKTAKQNAQKYYFSTTNKICSILYEKLNFTQEKKLYVYVEDISYKRNKYIHPHRGKNIKVDKDDILKWFEMLQTILGKLK
ncbi:MAG: response regulator [Campylobacterales bacterium]|nr:response regulator [Campylobacterales bacterium]